MSGDSDQSDEIDSALDFEFEQNSDDGEFETPPSAGASREWIVSLCFWSVLLCAAAMYGAVALAPKFAAWNSVRHQHRENARQLLSLEDDVDYLERVQEALETDPEFVQRLAGTAHASLGNDEERIPISGDLLFGYEPQEDRDRSTESSSPPYDFIVTPLATRTVLRRSLLILSACLTIFAFTFLNDAGTDLIYGTGRLLKRAAMLPVRRYTAGTDVESES